MISNTKITAQPEYDIQFWNAMRNKEAREDILAKGRDISTGTYSMPTVAAGKVMNEIEKESDFRKIATVIRAYKNGNRIFAKDCKDKAEFVAEELQFRYMKVQEISMKKRLQAISWHLSLHWMRIL